MIGVEPEPHQVTVMQEVAKPNARVALIGANGIGKDALCAWLVEWFLFCHGGVVPTTSASDRQVSILWKEINYWTGKSKAGNAFELLARKMYRKTNPQVYAEGFKAASASKMEGYHSPALLYIMTEARGVEDWGYNAMLKACSGEDNRILIQSVPGDESGEFYRIAQGMRPRWKVIMFPAAKRTRGGTAEKKFIPTTQLVSQDSIDEKLEYGEDSPWFQGPVLAQFTRASALSLISLGQYQAAIENYANISTDGQDILGVDVAWVGTNQTVLCHRRGGAIQDFKAYQGQRETQTAERCQEWAKACPQGIIVIEHGVAQAGVIDILIDNGFEDRLIEVSPGSPPMEEEKFGDRRSELYYYLMRRFEDGQIGVPDRFRNSPLGAQMTSIRKINRGDNKFQIESKKQMSSRGIPSPDWSDALMLTMAVSDTGVMSAGFHTSDIWAGGQRRARPDW